jgi:hypothetical protein
VRMEIPFMKRSHVAPPNRFNVGNAQPWEFVRLKAPANPALARFFSSRRVHRAFIGAA